MIRHTFVSITGKKEKSTVTPQTGAPAPAAAASTAAPINLTVAHPQTLSAADVLGIVNSAVDQDAPVVVQAIPGVTSQVSAYVTLGELGLGIVNQIVQAIHAAHKSTQQQ